MELLVAPRRLVRRDGGKDLVGAMTVGVAMLPVQGRGHVPDIVALVAVAGEGDVLPSQFQVAQPEGGAEDVHLTAGVVDVILAMDRKADRRQQVRHHGAIGRAPAMADVQGTGGVGGDELDLDPLARAHLAPAIVGPGGEDGRDQAQMGAGGQEEVDEAGAGDLGSRYQVRGRQGRDQTRRQVTGLATSGLRHDQGQIGGEIAMNRVAGAVHLGIREVRASDLTGRGQMPPCG